MNPPETVSYHPVHTLEATSGEKVIEGKQAI
jgi:hypothetical protein